MKDPSSPEIHIFDDDVSLDRFAAETITRQAQDAVEERGQCHLVLSGGGTPMPIYGLLGQAPYKERFPWAETHIYWGDERNVPPDNPGSNYGQVRDALLAHVPLRPENIHRIRGELTPVEAAADYRRQLSQAGTGELEWPMFDLVLLGMGDDGHTASLFPGAIDPQEDQLAALAVQAHYEDRPANRVTLTPVVFNTSRCIIYLVKGSRKAEAVASVLNGPLNRKRWPIHRIQPAAGVVLWLIGKEAATSM